MSPVELILPRDGGGGGSRRGAESYDREKAWPSILHSILSGIRLSWKNLKNRRVGRSSLIKMLTAANFSRFSNAYWHENVAKYSFAPNRILTLRIFLTTFLVLFRD